MLDADELRVEQVSAKVGDPAGEVLQWTSPQVHVVAEVTQSQRAALSAGDAVEVVLPSTEMVEGVIGRVGAEEPVEGEQGEEGAGEGGGQASAGRDAASGMVPVRIDVDDQDAITDLVGAAVGVEVVADSVESSLVVPVTALVALAEGGYAVERVAAGGAAELVAVEVLLVAEAQVAISSDLVVAGDEVVLP